MSLPATRIVSLLILAFWMSPGIGALGMGLHLALEHHHEESEAHGHDHHDGSHGDEHAMAISDLMQAATHGHHHDAEATSDHDHEATASGTVLTLRPNPPLASVLPALASSEVVLLDRSFLAGSTRRGPPVPLFTAHCSLLL